MTESDRFDRVVRRLLSVSHEEIHEYLAMLCGTAEAVPFPVGIKIRNQDQKQGQRQRTGVSVPHDYPNPFSKEIAQANSATLPLPKRWSCRCDMKYTDWERCICPSSPA
jgi:hypothetical protein